VSPRSRVRQVYRRAGRIESDSARAQLRLLRQMRRSLLGDLVDATGFRLFHLSAVLAAIDREIVRGRQAAQAAAADGVGRMWRTGLDLVDEPLRVALGTAGVLADLSGELLAAAIDVTTDQVRGVWSELGSRLKSTVRRVTIGITDPFQAVQQVARTIRDPKTFGTAEARAEAIVRTETNRTFAMASAKRMEQAGERLGTTIKKAWLDAGDHRVRPAHRAAAARYNEGAAIPNGKPFIVDGEALMFPLDPRGSAKNTVNCRCRLLPVVA
jgi:hypothetical protein